MSCIPPPKKKNVAEKKLAKRKVSQNDSSSDKYSPVVFNKTLGFICYGCAAAVSELISQIYALIWSQNQVLYWKQHKEIFLF